MHLIEAHTEGSTHGQYHCGEQGRAVRIVEPVKCPPESVIAERLKLLLLDPEEARRIGMYRLGLTVDRLVFGAAQCLG